MSSIRTESLLWRNGLIKDVVLFEENSILPLPECPEARWQCLVSDLLFGSWDVQYENVTPGELDSRSLQTLWEWKNRVLLEEHHIFNVVIPPEVE